MNHINNEFFSYKEKPYKNIIWKYLNTKKVLLGAIGCIKDSDKYVLIKQFRVPMNKWVISLPMGAFKEKNIDTLKKITRKEIEGETGFKVKNIEYSFQFYRSCGLTNEKMYIFDVIYDNIKIPQVLHDEEEIIPYLVSKNEIQDIVYNDTDCIIDSSILLLLNHKMN